MHAYDGGYSAYVLAQAERARNAEATERRRLNLARKELAWLRRGPQARSTKPKFRVQAANADRAVDLAVALSGAGVCRAVARAAGPVPGVTIVNSGLS